MARRPVRRPRRGAGGRGRARPGSRSSGCSPRGPGRPRHPARPARHRRRRARRARPASTRCASGPGRCARSRWPGPDGRPTRSRCCARCATCSTRSSASSPARSCARSRPRCCGRRPRPPRPSRAPRRRAATPLRRPIPTSTRRCRSRRCGAGRSPAATTSSPRCSELVDRVVAGARPRRRRSSALTGDPGIGKSRLAIEAATYAADQGMAIAWGRCSQDDGAPALWPWATVLERLGSELPTSGARTRAARRSAPGRPWSQRVLDRGDRAVPLMLVIDDLHWADTSSLRVLRLLTEAAVAEGPGPRLLVVTTWREHPPPEGALAEVAEALARKHALRLQLRGISADATAQVFARSPSPSPPTAETDALRRRTEGNPFFLVEYARLARERGDLAALMAEAAAAGRRARGAVAAARPARATTPATCSRPRACSAGSSSSATLAGTVGTRRGRRARRARPGARRRAGRRGRRRPVPVHPRAGARHRARPSLPASRRARMHARAAAAIADARGHEAEIARHWLAAGPRHVADAWPAAQAAARSATEVYAYVEALEMLEHALRAQDADPASDDRARFEILTDLADVLRRAGRWVELRGVAHEAIEVADDLGDVDLLVRAGEMTSTGSLWTPAGGDRRRGVVGALRRALDGLPAGDDPRRCRVMLALAGEIYYGATTQEREALAEEAVAMARRLGDPELILDAALKAIDRDLAPAHRRAAPGAGDRGRRARPRARRPRLAGVGARRCGRWRPASSATSRCWTSALGHRPRRGRPGPPRLRPHPARLHRDRLVRDARAGPRRPASTSSTWPGSASWSRSSGTTRRSPAR